MKTPAERYKTDPQFRALVDVMEAHIHTSNYTPSEMREAAILACINYVCHEMSHVRERAIPPNVERALDTLLNWSK